jgi:hypothetical protein
LSWCPGRVALSLSPTGFNAGIVWNFFSKLFQRNISDRLLEMCLLKTMIWPRRSCELKAYIEILNFCVSWKHRNLKFAK